MANINREIRRKENYKLLNTLNLSGAEKRRLRDLKPESLSRELKKLKINENISDKEINKIEKEINVIIEKTKEVKQKTTAPRKVRTRWDYIDVRDNRVEYLSRYTYNVEYFVGVKVGRGKYINLEESAMSISSSKELSRAEVLNRFWNNINNAPTNFYFSKDIIKKSVRVTEAFINFAA